MTCSQRTNASVEARARAGSSVDATRASPDNGSRGLGSFLDFYSLVYFTYMCVNSDNHLESTWIAHPR